MQYLKIRISSVSNEHTYCTIFESDDDVTYAKNGDLIFGNEAFAIFRDCLQRGRGARTVIRIDDEDMKQRVDWELANRSQS